MTLRSAVIAAVLILAPAASHAQSGYAVVRSGDGQMTCEALTSSMNALHGEIAEQARRAQRQAEGRQTAGRVGRGLLSGLAQGATMLGYSGGLGEGAGGAIASSALAGVANQIANAPPSEATPVPAEPAAQDTPRHQRLAHLNSLFSARPC